MSESKQSSLESKLGSSVLVITVPWLLLVVLGLFTGSFDLGTPELLLIQLVWLVGLVWVWRPRWMRRR